MNTSNQGSIHRALARFVPVPVECEIHGGSTAIAFPGTLPVCARCRQEYRAIELAAQAEREAHRQCEARKDSIGLLGRYRDATFSTFEASLPKQRRVLAACREFADDFNSQQGAGLWLIGPPGTGKTHLGSAIALAVCFQRNQDAIVSSAREIIRTIRETWARDAQRSERQAINAFGNVDLLVLDEVGVGFGSDCEITQLFDVLDLRYQQRRPTVLLSNLNAPQLKVTLGERLYDRLRDGATVLPCDWPSHRRPKPSSAGDGA